MGMVTELTARKSQVTSRHVVHPLRLVLAVPLREQGSVLLSLRTSLPSRSLGTIGTQRSYDYPTFRIEHSLIIRPPL